MACVPHNFRHSSPIPYFYFSFILRQRIADQLQHTPSLRRDPCRHRRRPSSILLRHLFPFAHHRLIQLCPQTFVVSRKVILRQPSGKMFSKFRRTLSHSPCSSHQFRDTPANGQIHSFHKGCVDSSAQSQCLQPLGIFTRQPPNHLMFHGHQSKSALTFDDLSVEEGFHDYPDRLSLSFYVNPFSKVCRQRKEVRTLTIEIVLQSIAAEHWNTTRFESRFKFVHYMVRHRLRARSNLQNRHQFRLCIHYRPNPDLMPCWFDISIEFIQLKMNQFQSHHEALMQFIPMFPAPRQPCTQRAFPNLQRFFQRRNIHPQALVNSKRDRRSWNAFSTESRIHFATDTVPYVFGS